MYFDCVSFFQLSFSYGFSSHFEKTKPIVPTYLIETKRNNFSLFCLFVKLNRYNVSQKNQDIGENNKI